MEVKTERFENWKWGIVCCCCGQRIPKGAMMAVEVRDGASQAETEWLYTRHYLRCPSSTRPHGFNVDLANAVIKLTDSFGTFQLENVVTSPSGRRASALTLPEIVHACTESLRPLSGPRDNWNNHRRRHIGNTSYRRITASVADDPASFLEDVAAEARSSRSEGRGGSRQEEQLRVKRAVCKATIEALLLRPPSPAGHRLTTRPGHLVVLPSPGAAPDAVPTPPRSFPRRVSFAPLAAADGATSGGQQLAVSPAARLLDTRPPPERRGKLYADEDERSLGHSADKKMATKALWAPRAATCSKQGGSERGKFRIAKESEKRRLA